MQSIKQLKRELLIAQRKEDLAERKRRRLEQRLGLAMARSLGVVKGRMYYYLPNNEGRKFLVEVRDIGTVNPKYGEYVGFLIRYHNRNGAYKSRWEYSNRGEFIPVKGAKNAICEQRRVSKTQRAVGVA